MSRRELISPSKGFDVKDNGYLAPTGKDVEVKISPDSNRLQVLHPFAPWDGNDLLEMPLLIKASGKCTTDHISMAGPWLRFRGHLENISDNMLMGAVNAFNGQTNAVLNQLNNTYEAVPPLPNSIRRKAFHPSWLPKRTTVKAPPVNTPLWNPVS